MKLVASGIFMGTLLSLAYATEQNGYQSQAMPASQSVNSVPVQQGTELQGPEPRDDKGGHHHYHYSHGQELFTGDEWMLALPLLLIPVIAFGCWYFWGGSKDEGYGWDRMGYSEGTNYPAPGAYESRMLRGADALDKRTHQRIFNAIQQ